MDRKTPACWDERAAQSSLARWDEVCAREAWGRIPADRPLLRAVFGASWYFTRFLFYRGRDAAVLLDQIGPAPDTESLHRCLTEAARGGSEELRIARNELLLKTLGRDLYARLPQERLEDVLTCIAEGSLHALLDVAIRERPALARLTILGMGRMACAEMNYGSDLDLIFLTPDPGRPAADILEAVPFLLRLCAAASPAGALYAIDTRLRPHGGAGALVSSLESYCAYHRLGERETWERQHMTRCRLLRDPGGRAASMLREVRAAIYAPRDPARMAEDVLALRERVERELGRPRGRYEIKRGPGGIMDVDFSAHYLQLVHGADYSALQEAGTRRTLRLAMENDLIEREVAGSLLAGYDFLKRLEGRLRLFDMQPVSAFSTQPEQLARLARGIGFSNDTHAEAGATLVEEYRRVTNEVRNAMQALLAERLPANARLSSSGS